jgi:serine protease AprX
LSTPSKDPFRLHRSLAERDRITRVPSPFKGLFRLPAALIGLILLALAAAAPAQAADRAATHIVQLERGVPLAEGRSLVRAAGGEVTGTVPIIRGVAARLPAGARSAIDRDDRVKAVSVNAAARSQGDLLDTSRLATAYPRSVYAVSSWPAATGAGVGVAVIDTGLDGRMLDFAAADGSSRVVASAVTNPDATTALDTYGHGTHVAGIIAGNGTNRLASDPVAGKYMGIAPRANLIAVKASDDAGGATILDAIYGLQFAVDHKVEFNIRVANLSLSSTVAESYRTDPLDAAVEAAYFSGIVVVAAAGNRGAADDAAWYAPGNDPFAVSVGAVDDQGTVLRSDDSYTAWSTLGRTQDGFAKPDIAAPGAHIVSTLAKGSAFSQLCPSCVVDDTYMRLGGTSMAAPVVAGIAALVLERHPGWTPAQVKGTLLATARDIPGRVDEANAAAAVWTDTPASVSGQNITPNQLVDPTTGAIDYTRSSWGRSSWGSAPDALVAGWARSSWGCSCPALEDPAAEPTRSSWGNDVSWDSGWSY